MQDGVAIVSERDVTFIDGSEIENVDVIIYATGYQADFPFLSRDLINMKVVCSSRSILVFFGSIMFSMISG